MRTTLDLPADLVSEACAVLGVTSASEAVELALRDIVRKSRAGELKALLGRVHFEFDPSELRRQERARASALETVDVRSLPSRGRRAQRRPKT